jgi:hypothetical protein
MAVESAEKETAAHGETGDQLLSPRDKIDKIVGVGPYYIVDHLETDPFAEGPPQTLGQALEIVNHVFPSARLEHTPLTQEQIITRTEDVFGEKVAKQINILFTTLPERIIERSLTIGQTLTEQEQQRICYGIRLGMFESARIILDSIPKYPSDKPGQGLWDNRERYGCLTSEVGLVTTIIFSAISSPLLRSNPDTFNRCGTLSRRHFVMEPLGKDVFDNNTRILIYTSVKGALDTREYIESLRQEAIDPKNFQIDWENPYKDSPGIDLIIRGNELSECLKRTGTREASLALSVCSAALLRLANRRIVLRQRGIEVSREISENAVRESQLALFRFRRYAILLFRDETLSDMLADEAFRCLSPELYHKYAEERSTSEAVYLADTKIPISPDNNHASILSWARALYVRNVFTNQAIRNIDEYNNALCIPTYVSDRIKGVFSFYLKRLGLYFPSKDILTKDALKSFPMVIPANEKLLDRYIGDTEAMVLGFMIPENHDTEAEPIDFEYYATYFYTVLSFAGIDAIGYHLKYLDKDKYPNYCAIHAWIRIGNTVKELRIMPEEYLHVYAAQHILHNYKKEGIPEYAPDGSRIWFQVSDITHWCDTTNADPDLRAKLRDGIAYTEAKIRIGLSTDSRTYPLTPIMHIPTGTVFDATTADAIYSELIRNTRFRLPSLTRYPHTIRSLSELPELRSPDLLFLFDALKFPYRTTCERVQDEGAKRRVLSPLDLHTSPLLFKFGGFSQATYYFPETPLITIHPHPGTMMATIVQSVPRLSAVITAADAGILTENIEMHCDTAGITWLNDIVKKHTDFTHFSQLATEGITMHNELPKGVQTTFLWSENELAMPPQGDTNEAIISITEPITEYFERNLADLTQQEEAIITRLRPETAEDASDLARTALQLAEELEKVQTAKSIIEPIATNLKSINSTHSRSEIISLIIDLLVIREKSRITKAKHIVDHKHLVTLIQVASSAGPAVENTIIRFLYDSIQNRNLSPQQFHAAVEVAEIDYRGLGFKPRYWATQFVFLVERDIPEFKEEYAKLCKGAFPISH